MSSNSRLVDRIVIYNGKCVRVNSVDEAGAAVVTALATPGRIVIPTARSVDLRNLEFHPQRSFDKVFPNSVPHPGSAFSVEEFVSGSILDLSHDSFPEGLHFDGLPWVIKTSCSIRGQPQDIVDLDTIDPVTCVSHVIDIKLKNANDVLEFEDICFKSKSTHAVRCSSGKSVTFRRCRFSSVGSGVIVCPDADKANCRARVTFESCKFECCRQHCVEASNSGQVLFLNCTFWSSDIAIHVKTGASVVARNCTVHEMSAWGAYVVDPKSELKLDRCSFRIRKEYAILAQVGAKLTVLSCFILHSEIGIKIEGPKRCVIFVEDCTFNNSSAGVQVRYGKVDLIVTDSRFVGAEKGLLVDWDVTGNVDVTNCTFDCRPEYRLVSLSYNKCLITVDGEVRQHMPLQSIRDIVKEHFDSNVPELCQQRVYKRAGVADVLCRHCFIIEPQDVKFKICARCRCVCYCSRQCQKEDWSEHKDICDMYAGDTDI